MVQDIWADHDVCKVAEANSDALQRLDEKSDVTVERME